MKKYENLFSPITVKNMTVRNRIAMLPMGTNFGGQNGEFLENHIKYYEQRAKGGTGLIIVENACVDFPLGSNGTTQIRLNEDRFIPALYNLTDRLHKQGACVAVQINHAGASAVPSRIGAQPVSSSNIPSKTGGAVPRPLTKEEIENIAQKYAEAARRAQIAGFDAVELHAGHSYLISQFLSPLYNDRTDEFGGSPENRARFCRLVIDKTIEQVGPNFPIILRLSADELLEGGNTLEDTLHILEYLNDRIDVFSVSCALNDSLYYQIDSMYLEDGWRAYMAEAVKKKFNKPVIAMGNIRNPKVAEEILASGKADFIGMGRGLIAEPNWAVKVESGKEDTLRKCISCNIGCAGHRIGLNRPIRCSVNPDLITEDGYKKRKVTKPVNAVVIGGGTSGLEAACTLAEVGCTTFLLEKKNTLGGLAKEIAKFPAKHRIADFPAYLEQRAKNLKNLITFVNTEADVEKVTNFKPDLIVNATGSKPLMPGIKGLKEFTDKENSNIYSIFGTIANLNNFEFENKEVVIIGGGAVGLDVVEFFAERGT
ncbi:MAG: FAD-dependent oxidoreductase, partial [Fusobacterium sp.]